MRLTREFRLATLIFVLAPGIGLATMPAPPTARGEPASEAKSVDRGTPRFRVIDGDTLEDMGADVTYRIVNIDTPETGPRARCEAERDLGETLIADGLARPWRGRRELWCDANGNLLP